MVFFNFASATGLGIIDSFQFWTEPQSRIIQGGCFRQQIILYFYDVTLFDVCAFSEGADALAIAARAGGVLLVARKNVTSLADISAMAEQLGSIGAEVVGSVMVEY